MITGDEGGDGLPEVELLEDALHVHLEASRSDLKDTISALSSAITVLSGWLGV